MNYSNRQCVYIIYGSMVVLFLFEMRQSFVNMCVCVVRLEGNVDRKQHLGKKEGWQRKHEKICITQKYAQFKMFCFSACKVSEKR